MEMLAKIPITETKGSLLSAIARLLRVIDISESSIMIPTLLKDRCEFDAYEMLTLAKILKASILGHNDLVEFYMSASSSQLNALQNTNALQAHNTNPNSISTINSNNNSNSTSTSASLINAHQRQLQQHNSNYQNQLRQLSSTPSLNSSRSDSTTSSPSMHLLHAESLSNSSTSSQLHLGFAGEPDATVRLLLQIEQLKTFIPQVTGIFESITELYKNSVDTYGS